MEPRILAALGATSISASQMALWTHAPEIYFDVTVRLRLGTPRSTVDIVVSLRRCNRLRKYQWQKGQSGNAQGRAMKLPMSDTLRMVLVMPLPQKLRMVLEQAIGETLPKNLSFMEGAAERPPAHG